jgi:hypothetical protein
MISACKAGGSLDGILLKNLLLLLLLAIFGCSSPLTREFKVFPAVPHDPVADRAACLEYAELYGVINLGPMMVDGMRNQPDRRRRNRLFVLCMEEKGYRFEPLREGTGE